MIEPKAKVFAPDFYKHDLSFNSIFTFNIGEAKLALNKHFFAGEKIDLGADFLLRFQALKCPAFQKYDIRLDSFIIPEDVHFKDVLSFYSRVAGVSKKDTPSPSVNPVAAYMAVALDSIYNVGMDSLKYNPFSGSLLDDLNCPTFDELLDEVRNLSDAELVSTYNTMFVLDDPSPVISSISVADLDNIVSMSEYVVNYPHPWYCLGLTLRQSAIVGIFLSCLFCGIDVSDPISLADASLSNSSLYKMHGLGKDLNLIPFLSYQSLWREYYRSGWIDDVDDGDVPESLGLAPYLPSDVDVLDLIPRFNVDDVISEDVVFNADAIGSASFSTPNDWITTPIFTAINLGSLSFNLNIIHNVFGKFDVNYVNDYFTSASLVANAENNVQIPLTSKVFGTNSHDTQAVGIAVPPGGGAAFVGSTGSVRGAVSVVNSGSIPDLRIANAMQILQEKAMLASGNRPFEFFKLNFGHIIPDSRLHRPQFINRVKRYVSIQEVTQTGMTSDDQPLGDVAGKGISIGSDGLFSNLVADEPCYVQVIVSVVPRPAYFQGFPIELTKTDPYDFLIPDLQHVGMRSIDSCELFVDYKGVDSPAGSFGFTDLYNEYRYSTDEIHGEFRSSMAYWTSVRRFGSTPRLNSDFLRVNSRDSELYKPFAVTSGYTSHLLCEMHFTLGVERPLDIYPYYSL